MIVKTLSSSTAVVTKAEWYAQPKFMDMMPAFTIGPSVLQLEVALEERIQKSSTSIHHA